MKTMTMKFNEIIKTLKKATNVAIFTHISIDEDCLGSATALKLALEGMGKNATIFSKSEIPNASKNIFDLNYIKSIDCNPKNFDCFVAVDLSEQSRMGSYGEVFKTQENTALIDHHHGGDLTLAKHCYIMPQSSSSAELVYKLLIKMKVEITPEIATALYAGLNSDTTSFSNAKTTTNSFLTAHKLINAGADYQKVNSMLHHNISQKEMAVKSLFMKKYEIIDDEMAFVFISYRELQSLGAKKEDCSSFSMDLLSIEGVLVSCALIERAPDDYTYSFRARVGYDISKEARKIKGGGHRQAAGAVLTGITQKDAISKAKKALADCLKAGKNA